MKKIFWNGYRWSEHHEPEPRPDTRNWGPSPLVPLIHGLHRIAKANELIKPFEVNLEVEAVFTSDEVLVGVREGQRALNELGKELAEHPLAETPKPDWHEMRLSPAVREIAYSSFSPRFDAEQKRINTNHVSIGPHRGSPEQRMQPCKQCNGSEDGTRWCVCVPVQRPALCPGGDAQCDDPECYCKRYDLIAKRRLESEYRAGLSRFTPIEFEPAGAPSRCKPDDPYDKHPAVYECIECDAQCCISCNLRLHEPGDPARRDEVKTIAKKCPRCRGLEVAAGTPFDPEMFQMRTGGVVVRYPAARGYVDMLGDDDEEGSPPSPAAPTPPRESGTNGPGDP